MKKNYTLTKAEQEVMEEIWKVSGPMRTKDLLDRMKEKGRDWKRQTLNTLLFRLDEKGVVTRKRGQVESALSNNNLQQNKAKDILDEAYKGRFDVFCAALLGRDELPDEEVQKLDALVDQWGK